VFSDVGTYSVSVIRYFTCGSDTSYQNIQIVPSPTITVNSATMCVNNTATLIASGATSYTWSSGLSSTTGSMVVGNPLTTTSYTVMGSGISDNCFGIKLPTLSISSSNSILCLGQQTATLNASGANTYTWSTADVGLSIVQNPTITTTYTVAGIDLNGCYNYTTSIVTVKSPPVISVNNATICLGQQTATLTANGANTYTWSTTDVGVSIVQSPTTTTTYTLVGNDVDGCYNYTTTIIQVNSLPIITVNSSTICLGQQVSTLTASGANTYTWNTTQTSPSIIQSPTITTTYSVIGVDNNMCFNTAVATVSVLSLPTITVSSAVGNTICPSSTITINANGTTNYTWNPTPNFSNTNGSSVIVSPLNNTTYTVIGNANGCIDTSEISIYIANNPTITATSATICSAQSGSISSSGGITYTWSPSTTLNTANGSNVIASPLTTTIYTVSGSSILGCVGSITTQVDVIPSPTITIIQNPSGILKIGDVVELSATSSANTYTWEPISFLSCSNCANPNASPSITTEYCVTSANANCTHSVCITVEIETPCATNETLGLPTAFSPNGDGVNDEYCLQGWNECVESFSILIYDRWGEKVFTTNDPNFCWDGKLLGKICDSAVFTYYAKAKLTNGTSFSKKGNITLIK
jgi:gliding motility-associated-like protein